MIDASCLAGKHDDPIEAQRTATRIWKSCSHGIENSILDLNATVRTGLTITDGIVGMEGDGPIMGSPKAVGFIAMGTDPVAVDATCARAIGIDPGRLGYLAAASAFLGHVDTAAIDQRGERLERYRTEFELPSRFQSMRRPA